MLSPHQKKNYAVYVDYENVKGWGKHHYFPDEIIAAIYHNLNKQETVCFTRIYVAMGLDNCEESISQKQVYKIYELGATLVPVPSFKGSGGEHIKNLADNTLTCEMITDLFTHKDIDVFVLASGDKDFIPLVRKIREYGKKVKLFYNEKPSYHLINEVKLQPDSEVINLGELLAGERMTMMGPEEMSYRQANEAHAIAQPRR